MWYVIQVISGQENRTISKLEKIISKDVLDNCIVPMRRLKKKYQGAWHEVTEKLFPGYVFLDTKKPQLLYEDLKMIPTLTKMLGNCEEYFTPLSEEDIRMLQRMLIWADCSGNNKKNEEVDKTVTGISKVMVDEGRQIHIVSGPLKNMEGQIKKVNLHKRIAIVEMEFMGNARLVHLGIEIMNNV